MMQRLATITKSDSHIPSDGQDSPNSRRSRGSNSLLVHHRRRHVGLRLAGPYSGAGRLARAVEAKRCGLRQCDEMHVM